ncbi:MAG: glutamate 5-kinase [Candidatus Omnitrophica bacterium]|nr:glutamate 5-kinase [Candidatus Omnitrophota bacterium]
MRKKVLGKIRRLVVKVGSTLLFSKTEGIDPERVHAITSQVAALTKDGVWVVLVSSGAIACGMKLLGLRNRPERLPELQAAAAVGQAKLMKLYDEDLRHKGLLTSQILLTQDDLQHHKRYWNARNTLLALLRFGAIPIVNENDTVATEEIRFGDNDRLSSLVACLIGADLLVILSDIDGLYRNFRTKGEGEILDVVEGVSTDIEEMASEEKGKFSSGGMKTKLQAAKIATGAGIPVVIANGRKERTLLKVISAETVGTLFLPKTDRMGARKSWIAFTSKPRGKVVVDEGAKNALLHHGRSLLSSGIVAAKEEFGGGEVVSIVDQKGTEFARGLINYSSREIEKIRGQRSDRILALLGYKSYDEVIHRDNLVIL